MFKKGFPVLVAVGLLAGCAKEKDYDEVVKTAELEFASAYQNKQTLLDLCTLEDPCLYVPSVTQTPYEVTASRPYWQGKERLVITDLSQKGKLQFLEIEDDARFDNNINNLSPVLNLSVSHVDYKCSEDEFGDCTNKEIEDSEKPWNLRRFVKISDLDVVETNTLPIDFGELFEGGCFSAIDQAIKKLDIEKDAMNVVVKKTYKANFRCAGQGISTYEELMDKLRYFTFTVDYSYSIVKLSSLADSKYKPVSYPTQDKTTFGFFTTVKKSRTVDNHDHVMGVRSEILNRWSPNKKEIVYYLNSDFYTKEMDSIRVATENAIAAVNNSLEKANATIKITLKKGNDSEIGDLRKNYIILVKDPQASGVIGYGPSVANPKTGEIINARTVMYYGTIQKFVSRAYDELVDEVLDELRAENEANNVANTEVQENPSTNNGNADSKVENFVVANPNASYAKYFGEMFNRHYSTASLQRNSVPQRQIFEEELDPETLYQSVKDKLAKKQSTYDQMIARLAEENFYHGSMVNYDEIVMREIKEEIITSQSVKYWDQLTETKRKTIMDKLLPYVWVPTLVHEFGHNLGLRHNFYGSTDTINFYSEKESRELGMRKAVTYSSIMDYAPKTNNELMVMGKYDIAALRFGYAREVELVNNTVAKIENSISEDNIIGLKPYRYCTDENVANDSLCNRHDEGTTHEEVIDYHIAQYEEFYEKANNRNRRYDFDSRYGDYGYFNRILSMFINIRDFFNTYDQMASKGRYEGNEWKENPTLVSIKKASDKSFNFFKDVIEQPAYHCVEIDKESQKISRIASFVEMVKGLPFEKTGIDFDIKYGCLILNNPQYGNPKMVYYEFGKYFNNVIDLTYDRSLIRQDDNSQIDVRGIWMDKILAAWITGIRFTSPTAVGAISSSNYFDYPEYKEELFKSVNGLLDNKIVKEIEVRANTGQVIKAKLPYGFGKNHEINKSFSPIINAIFGLKDAQTNMTSAMMNILKRQLINDQDAGNVESEDILTNFYYFDVDRVSTKLDLAQFNYDKVVEFKNKAGVVNYRFGVYNYNTKAMELAKLKEDLDLITSHEVENVQIAYALASKQATFDELVEAGVINDTNFDQITEIMKVEGGQILKILQSLADGSLSNQIILDGFLALTK